MASGGNTGNGNILAIICDQSTIESNPQNEDILGNKISFWAFGESMEDNQSPCFNKLNSNNIKLPLQTPPEF